MAIDIAELRVLVEVDDSPVTPALTRTEKEINAFGEKEFTSPTLDINIEAALAKIAKVRTAWDDALRAMSTGGGTGAVTVSSAGAAAPSSSSKTTTSGGSASVNPRTESATVAQVERIERTSAAKAKAIRDQTQTKIEEGARQSQSRIETITTQADVRRQQATLSRESAAAAAIDRIRNTAAARAQVQSERLDQIARAGEARRNQIALDGIQRGASSIDRIEAVAKTRRAQRAIDAQLNIDQIEATGDARRAVAKLARESATDDAVTRSARLGAQRQSDLVTTEALRTSSSVDRIHKQSQEKRAQAALSDEERLQRRLARIRQEAETRFNLRGEMAQRRNAALSPAQRVAKMADAAQSAGQENVTEGATLTATVTAPIAGATGLILNEGMQWESAFTGVAKTVDATSDELSVIQRQLRDMAAGPDPIPINVNELAAIAENAGSLGIAKENIAAFTHVMADLGQTTNLSSDEAATSIAKFANVMGTAGDEYDRVGSSLVALGNSGASTEKDIMEMTERLSGAGKQIGLTEAQVLGFGSALASVGIDAEAGGSAFSKFFVGIEQSVRNGGKELTLYSKLAGQSTAQFKKAFQTDAAGAIVSVIEGLKRLKDAGGNVFGVLDRLGMSEVRTRDALLRTSAAGDLVSESLRDATEAWEQNVALTNEAEKRYGTTESQLVIFQNRMRELAITISEKIGPAVNSLITSTSERLPAALGSVVEVASALPGWVIKAVGGLIAMVALAGPIQVLAGNVQMLSGAAMMLATAAIANPIAALLALAAGATAFVLISGAMETITKANKDLKENADELNETFGRTTSLLGKFKLPENEQLAGKIRKLRTEIIAAGTDAEKLDAALVRLTEVKREVNLKVKNPDLVLVLDDELTKAQKLLDQRQLTAKIAVEPLMKTVWNNIGLTTPGRPAWDMQGGHGFGTNNGLVDWALGWGWDGEGKDRNDFQLGPQEIQDVVYAREKGKAHTRKLKEAGRLAKVSGVQANINSSILTPYDANQKPAPPSVLNTLGLTKPGINFGVTLTPIPGDAIKPKPGPTAEQSNAAMLGLTPEQLRQQKLHDAKQRLAASPATGNKKGGAPNITDEDLESDNKAKSRKAKEEKEAREREARQNRINERLRAIQAQGIDVSARQFGSVADTMNSLQMQLLGIGETTDAARMKARMFAGEFKSIPNDIKLAAVEVARLVEQTEKLTAQRDAIRNDNNTTLSSLISQGADTSGFMAAVKAQESAYGFGKRIGNSKTGASNLASWVGTNARNTEAALAKKAAEMRDYNATNGDLGAAGGIGSGVRTRVTGEQIADLARKVHQGEMPKFKQTCAWAVSNMYKALGVELTTQNNNWAANLVSYAKKNWKQVDAKTAPAGALLAEPSKTANSGWHVTMSTGGLNRAGSNSRKPQFKQARANALAFVPPQLETAIPKTETPTTTSAADDNKPRPGEPIPNEAGLVPLPFGGYSSLKTWRYFNEKAKAEKAAKAGKPTAASAPPAKAPAKAPAGPKPAGASSQFTNEQNKLITNINALKAGFGDLVSEDGMRPGESRSHRMAAQERLFERLQKGEKITAEQMAADRKVANAADYDSARKTASDDAKNYSRDFLKAEADKIKILDAGKKALEESGGSMAAYEKAVFLAGRQVEIYSSREVVALWNQKRFAEANKMARELMAKASEGYDAAKGDASGQRIAEQTTTQTRALELLNLQRDYLAANAGKPEAVIANGLELLALRQAEYNRLIDENKTAEEAARLADLYLANEKVNRSQSDSIEIGKRLNTQRLEQKEAIDMLVAELGYLATGMNDGQRARQIAVDAAKRDKKKETDIAVEKGTMTPTDASNAVTEAGTAAGLRYDLEAGNRRTAAGNAFALDSEAGAKSRKARLGIIGRYGEGDPEGNIQLQIEEKRLELKLQNSQLAEAEKFDVEARLKAYEEQIRGEAEITRAQERRANIASAVEATLNAQKELELSMVTTAAARLEIEQRYQNLIAEKRKTPVSDEEKAEQAKQVSITKESDRMARLRANAVELRDLLANSLNEGSEKGMSAMARNYLQGLADMVKKASFLRLANMGIKALTGIDPSNGEKDIFDTWKEGRQKPETGKTPPAKGKTAMPEWMSAAGALLGGTGFAGALGGAAGGGAGGQSTTIENATFNIQNAVENIQNAVINTRGQAANPFAGGPGSTNSTEQIATTVLGILAGR